MPYYTNSWHHQPAHRPATRPRRRTGHIALRATIYGKVRGVRPGPRGAMRQRSMTSWRRPNHSPGSTHSLLAFALASGSRLGGCAPRSAPQDDLRVTFRLAGGSRYEQAFDSHPDSSPQRGEERKGPALARGFSAGRDTAGRHCREFGAKRGCRAWLVHPAVSYKIRFENAALVQLNGLPPAAFDALVECVVGALPPAASPPPGPPASRTLSPPSSRR